MTYLASSAGALIVDRNNWQSSSNTWQGRANNAWGTSRVWNTGASFETDLANMTTDRNTWRTNANTAYDSGTWGTGTHWHTRHDNLLNGLGGSPQVVSAGVSGSGLQTGFGTRGSIAIPKTGYWLIYARISLSVGNHMTIRLLENGATERNRLGNIGGTVGGSPTYGNMSTWEIFYGVAQINAGTTYQVQTDHTNGFDTIGGGGLWATFIPTTGNP